eukprot:Trichotokara_eunicae@DN5945_c0_g2_i1.p1
MLRIPSFGESRAYGNKGPMITSDTVKILGKAYQKLSKARANWALREDYCNPGPVQFQGALAATFNQTLYEEHHEYLEMLTAVKEKLRYIRSACTYGVPSDLLQITETTLSFVQKGLSTLEQEDKDHRAERQKLQSRISQDFTFPSRLSGEFTGRLSGDFTKLLKDV